MIFCTTQVSYQYLILLVLPSIISAHPLYITYEIDDPGPSSLLSLGRYGVVLKQRVAQACVDFHVNTAPNSYTVRLSIIIKLF